MRLGVVMVSFNSAKTIGRAIESFLSQHHADKRLVVIDGASTDGTQELVASFKTREIRLISEPDGGIFDAMNKGLREFEGDAVGFLNSDDVYHSTASLGLISDKLEGCDVVYGDVRFVTDHESKRVTRIWKAGPFPRSGFKYGWMAPHPTFYLRRQLVERIGMFDLRYPITSDYDFMLRAISETGVRVAYIPQFLVDFKVGGFSTRSVRTVVRGNFECLDSRRRHLGHSLLDLALVLKPLRKLPHHWPRLAVHKIDKEPRR